MLKQTKAWARLSSIIINLKGFEAKCNFIKSQSYYDIRKKNSEVGRAVFIFFLKSLKIQYVQLDRFTTEGSALIYLTYLVTAPENLPKLELMTTGGKTSISSPEEQMYKFYFWMVYINSIS